MRVAVKSTGWGKRKKYKNRIYTGAGKRDAHPKETTRPGINLA
jgi:hypothetical protein